MRQAAICRAVAWASASTLGMDFFQGGGDRLLKMRVGRLVCRGAFKGHGISPICARSGNAPFLLNRIGLIGNRLTAPHSRKLNRLNWRVLFSPP